MGVSGAGKTVVGSALAALLGWVFVDADDLHPASNRDKMRAGIPLTDDDRQPWLRAVGERLRSEVGVVAACSSLKRRYRDLLRDYVPDVYFVHLDIEREVLQERLARRSHEYMPASLLDSQLSALEPLGPDEYGDTVRPAGSPETTAAAIEAELTGAEAPSAR